MPSTEKRKRPVDIEELSRLEKAATPSPWWRSHGAVLGPSTSSRLGNLVSMSGYGELQYGSARSDPKFGSPDARLITAMRNALPDLLDEINHLRKEVDKLKADLYNAYRDIT